LWNVVVFNGRKRQNKVNLADPMTKRTDFHPRIGPDNVVRGKGPVSKVVPLLSGFWQVEIIFAPGERCQKKGKKVRVGKKATVLHLNFLRDIRKNMLRGWPKRSKNREGKGH